MDTEFQGKTAIVTGAASGMGLCFSKEWAKQGGHPVMCDISEDRLKECVADINAMGCGTAIGVVCDVRDYA